MTVGRVQRDGRGVTAAVRLLSAGRKSRLCTSKRRRIRLTLVGVCTLQVAVVLLDAKLVLGFDWSVIVHVHTAAAAAMMLVMMMTRMQIW